MRKYVIPILIVLLLAVPGVVAHWIGAGTRPPRAVSDASRALLDVVTPHNQDIRNEFGPAFDAWHQRKYGKGVEVRFNIPGGTGDVAKLLRATYAGSDKNPNFKAPYDIAWGGGDFFFDNEIGEFLQPCALSQKYLDEVYPEAKLAGVKLYDQRRDGVRWVGICISAFGIVYSQDVYDQLGLPAPATWVDLTKPELAGWVALANPMSSSSTAAAYAMVYQRAMADEEERLLVTRPELGKLSTAERMKVPEYKAAMGRGWKRGMGTLMLVAANARYFSDSGTQPSGDVASGDAAAAFAIDFYGRNYEGTVGARRAKLIAPKGATAINPDPAAILKGVTGARYDIANHFLEFLLSEQAQQIWFAKPGTPGGPVERALYRTPVRRDLYTDAHTATWSDPEVNPFTDANGFNARPEWSVLFSETKLLWAASWIDDRSDLQACYKAILAVQDSARRAALLADFADMPMTYDKLESIRADLKKQPREKVDEYRARLRINLAKTFREHYARIRSKAAE